MNAVRSPMAQAMFRHYFGRSDLCANPPACAKASRIRFAVAAMDEIGLDITKHRPHTFEELEDAEG